MYQCWIQDYSREGANQSYNSGGGGSGGGQLLSYTSKGNGTCASYYEQLCGVNRIHQKVK